MQKGRSSDFLYTTFARSTLTLNTAPSALQQHIIDLVEALARSA